tara:strand:- start:1 stop:390 length:390 start_codon:yes stop_codon:yes gene_type:complete
MTITIIRGVSGSGKTTYAKKIEALHLENDMFCMQDGVYEFDFDEIKRRAGHCLRLAKLAAKTECDIVISNTFTQVWEMQPYLDLAKKHNAKLKVIALKTKYKNTHGVPDFAIERMYSRWEDFEGEKIIK